MRVRRDSEYAGIYEERTKMVELIGLASSYNQAISSCTCGNHYFVEQIQVLRFFDRPARCMDAVKCMAGRASPKVTTVNTNDDPTCA